MTRLVVFVPPCCFPDRVFNGSLFYFRSKNDKLVVDLNVKDDEYILLPAQTEPSICIYIY